MSTATVSLFFAILSLAALAGAAAVIVGMALSRRPNVPDRLVVLRSDLARVALPVAWLVATVSTLGSLYYSEVAHFVPCPLCWYQRIAMYPLALLLGIATFRRDTGIRIYVIAQCAVGAVISTYHTYIQAFPPTGGSSFCTVEAPCTERYVWEFGFVSLPFMALTAFVCIITLMLALDRAEPLT